MEINFVDIVIHVINIVVLFIILKALIYKPVIKFMNGRKAEINDALEKNSQTRDELEQEKAQLEQALLGAEKTARQKSDEILIDAHSSAEKILAEARDEAAKIVEASRGKADSLREEMMSDMQDEVKDISIKIAEKILSREINEEDNRAIISNFFNRASSEVNVQ